MPSLLGYKIWKLEKVSDKQEIYTLGRRCGEDSGLGTSAVQGTPQTPQPTSTQNSGATKYVNSDLFH